MQAGGPAQSQPRSPRATKAIETVSLSQILVEQLEEELLRHLRLQVTHEQSAVGLRGRRPHLRAVPVSGLGCLLAAHRP